ncbi:MAG TPA: ADOP family duplicated permease [Vicinamibacterales bacterium]|nr:ADOP family duplicated permease [Vicinamibacterales bacterium]
MRTRLSATIEALAQDVRFALRVLTRDRGFALTAMIVLGVGLGVNNMFFTLVYAHKFRGVPIANPDRVLFISTFDDRVSNRAISLPEFNELREAQTSFTSLGAYVNGVATIGDRDRPPDRFDATYFTAGTFELFGIAPSMGRLPSAAEDRPGSPAVVLLGAELWRLRYAADPQILGRTVLVNGSAVTVIGIVPDRSGFPSTANVWMPLGQWPNWKDDRAARALSVVGRLRGDVSVAAARSEVETIFGRFESAYPDSNRNLRARVVTLKEALLGNLDGWRQFIVAGIIVILVACANVANLMMARALHRAPEIAIRTSLGASRGRVIVQLLIEATVIAGGGAIIGAAVSLAGVRAIDAGIPDWILPYWTAYTMDRAVFAALVALALVTIIVFGLVPALHASRTDVNRTLKIAGPGATNTPGLHVWTGGFLTVQLALAMILLAQLAVASYIANQDIPTDANVNTTEIVTGTITLPAASYPTAERRMEFFARLEERLRSRTEIVATSRGTILPGDGGPLRRLRVRGQEQPPGSTGPTVLAVEVAPGYFETLAIGVLRGRDFNAVDGTNGNTTAIVNQRFAEVFFDSADPMNGQVAVSPANQPAPAQPQWLTIVGVAPTIRHLSAGAESPVIYLPIAASAPATSSLMVRHRTDPETAASLMRTEAHAVDPDVAIYRMRTLKQAVRDAQWTRHTSAVLADTVTYMSVLLAIVGLYAVTAQRVTLKTREIGLRMALGARALQVGSVIIRGLRVPLLLGFLLGTAGSMGWDGAYSSGMQGVYTSAPPTLLKVGGLLALFVLISCAIPILRAIRTNPMAALRHD